MNSSKNLIFGGPSAEVREEAFARAGRIASTLFPHQVDGAASVKRNWAREVEIALPGASALVIDSSPRSNSRLGQFYALDVDSGGEVMCKCPGFEYWGACSHVRQLKNVLATGGDLPERFEVIAEATGGSR